MNKRFSVWEVLISGAIVLVLAFVLIGSVAILNRTNSRLASAKTREKCISDLQRSIESEFGKATKIYAVSLEPSEPKLQKIDESADNSSGIAFARDGELRIFIKQKQDNKSRYNYLFYNLDQNLEFSGEKALSELGKPINSEDLFGDKCIANGADKPFTLQMINKFKTSQKAIMLNLQDKITSKQNDSEENLFLKVANEFN